MCVLALAWQVTPEWPVVLIANRDEFHARSSAPLHKWQDGSGIIAGQDLQSGGTWLGVGKHGRVSAVTNVRSADGPHAGMLTRGALVTAALADGPAALDAFAPAAYNGFNLIAVDATQARFLGNSPSGHQLELSPGLYGLSNGAFDAPWRKSEFLKAGLKIWLDQGQGRADALFALLANESCSGRVALPLPAQPGMVDAADTPAFIRSPVYGTRCSTVVTLAADGSGMVAERRFDASGNVSGEDQIEFHWS
jgi:uncharacterized protein with NRDE domain